MLGHAPSFSSSNQQPRIGSAQPGSSREIVAEDLQKRSGHPTLAGILTKARVEKIEVVMQPGATTQPRHLSGTIVGIESHLFAPSASSWISTTRSTFRGRRSNRNSSPLYGPLRTKMALIIGAAPGTPTVGVDSAVADNSARTVGEATW